MDHIRKGCRASVAGTSGSRMKALLLVFSSLFGLTDLIMLTTDPKKDQIFLLMNGWQSTSLKLSHQSCQQICSACFPCVLLTPSILDEILKRSIK